MQEDINIKIIFDGASYWLGNKLVYSINPNLEHRPTISGLAVWTFSNVILRYNIIEFLKKKEIILTNDDIYFALGAMATIISILPLPFSQNKKESFYKIVKINGVGTLSNILMSRFVHPKK
jgi:hypothetical protein